MNNNNAFPVTLGWILLAALSRLLPHPANVTPVAAMALLGGAYLGRRQSLLFPLAALFISDLFLGLHATMPFVYGSFLITAMIGQNLKGSNFTSGRMLGLSLSSSVIFFVATNFGTWLTQNIYSRDFQGLAACFTAAIPFFRHTLLGDLGFTIALFGLHALSLRALGTAVRPQTA